MIMPVLEPSSQQARERERVILFKIISPVAAIALAYEIVSACPPVLFLIAFGLQGIAFAAILLWGNHRKRGSLAMIAAYSLFWIGRSVIERLFFGRASTDMMPWSAIIAEFAIFWLGCAFAFTFWRLWKPTQEKAESNV